MKTPFGAQTPVAGIDGKTIGMAIFDHPSNPRHPTWWHARYYGLVAANPFGIHDFEKQPDGTGDLTIPAGKSVTFRYRFLFHEGDYKAADILGYNLDTGEWAMVLDGSDLGINTNNLRAFDWMADQV